MAKKRKKVDKAVATSLACGPDKPRLYLDLQGHDVTQIAGLKVGQKVQLLVEGTVKGLSQRERQDYDDAKKTVKTGDIQLEGYEVTVLEEGNEFEEMAGDD